MKKLLTIAIAAVMALPAVVFAQKAYIVKTDAEKIESDSITYDKDKKQYMYKQGQGQVPIKKTLVKFAWVPKPAEIESADALLKDGKGADAAAAYDAAGAQYEFLGWKTYCLVRKAESLGVAGKTDESIKLLEEVRLMTDPNPANAKYISQAQQLLGKTYLAAKKWKEAEAFINVMTDVADPNEACSAFILRGDILRAQAKEKTGAEQSKMLEKAALAYFEAALLFDNAATRPLALYNSYEIMTELKDARAQKFANILRQKYPNSEYTQKLK